MIRRMTVVAAVLCLLLGSCGRGDEAEETAVREAWEKELTHEAWQEESPEDEAEKAEAPGLQEEAPEEVTLYVYVCGAVRRPGVYTFAPDERWYAAVEKAGGLTEEADPDQVNLALPLADGQRLYIPRKGEEAVSSGNGTGWEEAAPAQEAVGQSLVNLNTADAEELITLPGIGKTRAESILAYRKERGRFQRPEELMQVEGIKEKTYEKLRDFITIE